MKEEKQPNYGLSNTKEEDRKNKYRDILIPI